MIYKKTIEFSFLSVIFHFQHLNLSGFLYCLCKRKIGWKSFDFNHEFQFKWHQHLAKKSIKWNKWISNLLVWISYEKYWWLAGCIPDEWQMSNDAWWTTPWFSSLKKFALFCFLYCSTIFFLPKGSNYFCIHCIACTQTADVNAISTEIQDRNRNFSG